MASIVFPNIFRQPHITTYVMCIAFRAVKVECITIPYGQERLWSIVSYSLVIWQFAIEHC